MVKWGNSGIIMCIIYVLLVVLFTIKLKIIISTTYNFTVHTFRSETLKSRSYGKGWSSFLSDDLFGFGAGSRSGVDIPSR